MTTLKNNTKAKIGKKRVTTRKNTTKQSFITRIPLGMRYVMLVTVVLLFSSVCYYFIFRPYMHKWRKCKGVFAYDTCVPCGYDVHGIDISHHQGNIDWWQLNKARYLKTPIEFIFIKATEGDDHLDTAFNRNFEEARKFGFMRGAYHFFSSKTDPKIQAENYIKTVNLLAGDLPPVLDVEEARFSTAKVLQKNVKVWLDEIEGHYGVKPIIYTSYHFKNKYLNHEMFDAYPYWIAHYYVDSVKYTGKWHFWQHSDIGTLPGIKTDVDLNVFKGSLSDLDSLTIK